jgi:hypothetical protein
VKVNRGRHSDPAQQQEVHAMKQEVDGCMFEPVAITYPSGHSKIEKGSEEKAFDVDQNSSGVLYSQGIPFWCVGEENRESIFGRHLFHPIV